MGDLNIDVDELTKALDIAKDMGKIDIQKAVVSDAARKLRSRIMGAEAEMIKPTRAPDTRELGGFRIVKANNGFVVYVGRGDGYSPDDAYVCKEADEIGDLITAHIVSKALED